jgi:hypothetical protein
MPRIFISYRRDDTLSFTGRLDERLAARFGRRNVFRDLESVGGGDEFRNVIPDRLRKCDICMVIIGDCWLTSRLQDSSDLVRIEIETALTLALRVIPVLTGKAGMPEKADLPETLQPLLDRNAVEVREAQFDRDVKALISQLGANWRTWIIAAACLSFLMLGAWGATSYRGDPPVPSKGPVSAEQKTTGDQSPAVQGVKGDVTITYDSGQAPKPEPGAKRLETKEPRAK